MYTNAEQCICTTKLYLRLLASEAQLGLTKGIIIHVVPKNRLYESKLFSLRICFRCSTNPHYLVCMRTAHRNHYKADPLSIRSLAKRPANQSDPASHTGWILFKTKCVNQAMRYFREKGPSAYIIIRAVSSHLNVGGRNRSIWDPIYSERRWIKKAGT